MTVTITSPQNQRIKDAIKLRNHRERVRQQRFVIDGAREIEHAIAGGIEFVEAFVCPSHCDDVDGLRERLEDNGAEVAEVSDPVWEKLAFGQRREGAVVVARPPNRGLAEMDPGTCPFVVVLEAIEKPGNIGAVIRTADAAGASAVIVTEPVSDLYNPNTIRASLGTLFRMPVVACANDEAMDWLQRHEVTPFAAIVETEMEYTAADFAAPCAVVMGSEAQGLSEAWRGVGVVGVRLPMHGQADSLNISAAAAVLMYEVARQRK